MKRYLVVLGAAALLISASALAGDKGAKSEAKAAAATPASEHVMYTPADLKWVDAPASLPKGAKMAVVAGDPMAPGLFTMRVTLPAGYKVPAHYHPADEHVTVVSGELHIALGEKLDETKGHALPAGSFTVMPKGVRHFAYVKGETVIQIHGMGPWGITYVNPADNPASQKQATN